MKKENKVTSQELSKRLDALGGLKGVESEWWWAKDNYNGNWHIVKKGQTFRAMADEIDAGEYYDHIPAYDIAELGEWLPVVIKASTEQEFSLNIDKGKNGWKIYYIDFDRKKYYEQSFEETHEAEVRGLMAEYLIKNKLI